MQFCKRRNCKLFIYFYFKKHLRASVTHAFTPPVLYCCVLPFYTSLPNIMASPAHDILPPPKRRKEDKAEPALFFDSLPKEILDNVLRYFSRIPNAKKWESHIDVRNLVEACGVGGGFGTLLKSRFHTLLVSCTKNYFETMDSGWSELSEPYLWTQDIAVARAFVVAGGGEALRSIVISRHMYYRERDGQNVVDDFAKYCPNVTSMKIAEEVTWFGRTSYGILKSNLVGFLRL